jgi:hypothetical protein
MNNMIFQISSKSKRKTLDNLDGNNLKTNKLKQKNIKNHSFSKIDDFKGKKDSSKLICLYDSNKLNLNKKIKENSK